MKGKEWGIVIVVVIVVAVIASLITANLTGNTIRTPNLGYGANIYTKAEIDSKLGNLGYANILQRLEQNQDALDISLADAGWDLDSDGYVTGDEVCKSKQKECLVVLNEYIVGHTVYSPTASNLNLEPLACTDKQPIQINATLPNILDVWCVS